VRGAKSFEDLDVYRRSLEAAHGVYLRSRAFPREERYALTDQILRSSRSVGALVAESWARRRYRAAFAEKLCQAMAESMETQAWLNHAFACGYLSEEEYRTMHAQWQTVGAGLRRMIQKSSSFCP
jgi:four helix bundle protein